MTLLAASAALVVTATPRNASADDAEKENEAAGWDARPEAPPRAPSPAATPRTSQGDSASRDGKRAIPDYDGRPDVPADDGVAIWTARVLLAPGRLVTEALIREPARGLVLLAQEVELIGGVADATTRDPDSTVGLTPIGVIELGNRPLLGMYAQIEHLIAPWERLRAVAMIGGTDVMRSHLVDEMGLSDSARLELGFAALRRDDLLTWGTGPNADGSAAGTYAVASLEGNATFHITLADRDLAYVETWTSLRRARIDNGDCDDGVLVPRDGAPSFRCEGPTVVERARAGDASLPPGFGNTTTLGAGARFVLDAPPPQGTPSLGGRLDLRAEEKAILDGPRDGAWVAWGARGSLAADLTGTRRVLSLGAQLDLAVPLADDVAIPLLDLPGAQRLDDDLGGDLLLGLRPGRTVGRSLIQAALDYQWPVWTALDAHLQAGVGNAFGARLDGFEPGQLRFAFAGGFVAQLRRDYALRILAGFSTDTFDRGTEPALARLLIGGNTDL